MAVSTLEVADRLVVNCETMSLTTISATVVPKVVGGLASLWKDRARSAKLTVCDHLAEVEQVCDQLLQLRRKKDDATARVVHERIKETYNMTSQVLGGRLSESEVDIVLTALASARVYYWGRVLRRAPDDELCELWERRLRDSRGEQVGALPASLKCALDDWFEKRSARRNQASPIALALEDSFARDLGKLRSLRLQKCSGVGRSR